MSSFCDNTLKIFQILLNPYPTVIKQASCYKSTKTCKLFSMLLHSSSYVPGSLLHEKTQDKIYKKTNQDIKGFKVVSFNTYVNQNQILNLYFDLYFHLHH